MVKTFHRFDILLIKLNPTLGSEINKTRPCIVISPDEMNKYLNTLIIAPITSSIKNYPTRICLMLEKKQGNIVLDQIRTIDKSKVIKKLGVLESETRSLLIKTLLELFA